jgi:hypothetical protein
MKKKEARPTSPPVVPMVAPFALRFRPLLCFVIFFLTQGSVCNILACKLMRYCTCSPYCCYTCSLNILGTRIEASVSSSWNRGVRSGISAISIAGRKPS